MDAPKPFTLVVEQGKVNEFTRAVALPGRDGPREHADLSPPTFLMSAAFWCGPENLAITHDERFDRTLHAGVEFVFEGPPPAPGTRLTGQARLGAVTEKAGRRGGRMEFTDEVVDYVDDSGALVVRYTSTTVVVEKPPAQ
ncbi:MaoC family dehydratase N-terminal domain-containing protein [Sporichthya sp.]|uniref:FAS1-like dehydratase domain-containing protein n=1 Tax=Sporichthya sp. TaxID=65475 RepID=UPI0017AA9F07|nr:MaoC family dehydratase N-terminal domain-containing protein [Sporichthya sp.]MBA3743122.1 MaoC family dehydratase N-terminal domain-containing protein [Sporichthya sp.]